MLEKALSVLILLACAGNAALYVEGATRIPGKPNLERDTARKQGLTPTPIGYSADLKPIRLSGENPSQAVAIRYLSRRCKFCKTDERGRELMRYFEEQGLYVFSLLPGAIDAAEESDVPYGSQRQVAFVPIGWMKRWNLMATPSILVIAPDGRLLWSHQGSIGVEDATAAEAALHAQR